MPPNDYTARVVDADVKKLFDSMRLVLSFELMECEQAGTVLRFIAELPTMVNGKGKRKRLALKLDIGPHSRYARAWRLANGGPPLRADRMKVAVFRDGVFRIRVRDVKADRLQRPGWTPMSPPLRPSGPRSGVSVPGNRRRMNGRRRSRRYASGPGAARSRANSHPRRRRCGLTRHGERRCGRTRTDQPYGAAGCAGSVSAAALDGLGVRAMTLPRRDIHCVRCDAMSPGRLLFGLAERWAVLRDVHGALHGVCADLLPARAQRGEYVGFVPASAE